MRGSFLVLYEDGTTEDLPADTRVTTTARVKSTGFGRRSRDDGSTTLGKIGRQERGGADIVVIEREETDPHRAATMVGWADEIEALRAELERARPLLAERWAKDMAAGDPPP